MKPDFISSDDLLGKEVLDKNGALLGVIDQLYFKKDFSFAGISIDRGMLKDGLFVSKQYLERVTSHLVFLNTKPVFELKGVPVYDKTGLTVGIVQKIHVRKGNEIDSIDVKLNMFKTVNISHEFVAKTGQGVFLNIVKEEIKEVSTQSRSKMN